jgi:hypothetical protein
MRFHTHTLSNEGKLSSFHPFSLWRGTEASAWVGHACSLLVVGKIEALIEEIVVLPPMPPEPVTSRSVPEIERDYFINNAARMLYPAFRSQVVDVGSGIAEAAFKMVVSTRAKRADMRWTKDFHPIFLFLLSIPTMGKPQISFFQFYCYTNGGFLCLRKRPSLLKKSTDEF